MNEKKNIKKPRKKNSVKKVKKWDINETNKIDIIIDEDRLKDYDSLDTSFLEGKNKSKRKRTNIEELTNPIKKEKTDINFIRLFIIILISIILGSLLTYIIGYEKFNKVKIVTKEVEKKVVDTNYLFLGDSITEGYDLKKYFKNKPVVNSGKNGHATEDILNDMEERVYKYNPSDIFILIGTNDLHFEKTPEQIVENISKIIKEIKENRPLAKIYLEEVYPINNTDNKKINKKQVGLRTNENIKKINEGINNLCEKEKVKCLKFYDILSDEEGNLKLEYTIEGLHINKEGYNKITEELKKYIK